MSAPAAGQDGRQTKALPKATQPAPAIDVPKIRYTDFTLPNGLRVIMHEDHSSPIVAVELWYNVGSKDERPGNSGLSHMFEHMMDEGTLNMPAGEFKRVLQSAGGTSNAMTQNDWTRYYMTMPSNHLETALWLEAERMANLSPTLDSNRFVLEREAVYNEYRDRILNVAVFSGAEALFEAMFPNGGVYSTPLFGYRADLAKATVADLRKWYETYYVPNNAVLVVAGDLNPADARRKIEKQFGAIPRGKPIPKVSPVTPLKGETRLVVEHPSGVRQFWIAWRGARITAPDKPATMALSSILSERLRRLLVDERRIAQSINPQLNRNFDMRDAAVFQVAVFPTPTASATEIERLVDSVVASIRTAGVTETEVRRWVNSYRMEMLTSMQMVRTKAEYLGDATTTTNNPGATFDIVERAQRTTAAAVGAAARKYLTADRVVLSIVPTGKLDLISRPDLPYVNATRKTP